MVSAFRFKPPRARAEWIERQRLLDRLQARFDLDVTVIAAPAGYGKTSLLAQMFARAHEPGYVDAWLQCDALDEDAGVFGHDVLRALGVETAAEGVDEADLASAVIDALMRFAPQQVCLVLDDVHVLTPDSEGSALLARVLDRLPRNAHLVLCGRTMPATPLNKRFSHGRAERFGLGDLAYDDDELDRLSLHADVPGDALDALRWPASARVASGGDETVSELLVEIAAGRGPRDRAALTALSLLASVDDATVTAAVGSPCSADALLGDVPLAQRADNGSFQIHELWRHALCEDAVPGPEAHAAMCRVGEQLLADCRHVEAAELFVAGGSAVGVERTARSILEQPLLSTSAAELRAVARASREVLGEHPVTDMLAASVAETGDERRSAERFQDAAARAATLGERDLAALALQNAMNMWTIVDPASLDEHLLAQADALAVAGSSMARSVATVIRSHHARLAGDPERSAAILGELSGALSPMIASAYAFGLSDLGRPEDVYTVERAGGSLADMAEAGGQVSAQAVWLRGDVSPEVALLLGSQLADATESSHVAHQTTSTTAVLALVACAAGDLAAAEQFVARAARWSSRSVSVHVRGLAVVAEAALLWCIGDRPAAAVRLDQMVAALPIGRWPPRAYLYALPMVYALVPATRDRLDACRFGPAFTIVQQAARAIVALEERADAGPAAELPWSRADLLRAHVLPPHLASLAAGAAVTGAPDVATVLGQIPSLREQLVRVGELRHGPAAAWARERLATLPVRPPYDLSVRLLGPVELWRGATEVTDPTWVKRDRVRQLFALIVTHRQLSRHRAAELLWPELPLDRALANLRVNLSHLQRVLQPARGVNERTWFLTADVEMLTLANDGIDVDVHHFDHRAATARRLDAAGRITGAIDEYAAAGEMYRGDFLGGLPGATWAEGERHRLRALALGVQTRLAELLLARGEPEDACRWASTALHWEPLHEPAGRCLVKALAGQGDRAGAVRALRQLVDRVRAEGFRCERETLRLAPSLGVEV